MSIALRFKLTFEDYLKAQQLHSRRTLLCRTWYILCRTLLPVVGLLYLLVFVVALWRTTPIGWLIVAFACGTYFMFYPLFARLRLGRCYRRTRTGDGESTIELSEEKIQVTAENMSGVFEWKAVQSLNEDKNVFLLYLAPAKFVVLPKRACSPEQISELQSLMTKQVQSKASVS